MKSPASLKNLAVCSTALIPGILVGQVTLQEWTFNEPDGTPLHQAVNSGDPGGWVFQDVFTTDQVVLTGGALRVLGGSVGNTATVAANIISDLQFTSGVYELSFTISGFDLFNVTGPGATLAWAQFLIKSGGANIGLIRLEEGRDGALRIWARPPAAGEGDPTIIPLTTTSFFIGPITITATLDMDEGTIIMAVDSPEPGISTSVGPLPLQLYQPGDAFTGFSFVSNFSAERSSAADYLDIGMIRLTGPEAVIINDTWAGYEIDEAGWVDTGDFMGWLFIAGAPWVYSLSLGQWIAMPEEAVSDLGGWIYAGK